MVLKSGRALDGDSRAAVEGRHLPSHPWGLEHFDLPISIVQGPIC